MKIVYVSDDGKEVFKSKKLALAYERAMKRTVSVPLVLLREAIRQCTPYHIAKKERDWLREMLERHLPKSEHSAKSETP